MSAEPKCDYCAATLHKNATLVHTERYNGLWDLDCSMCSDCFKQFKVMLEKAKTQKSWTGWTTLEKEVASLKKESESLKSELQFLRHENPIGDHIMTVDMELVTVKTKACDYTAHRSILMSRSDVFKKVLTSEKFRNQNRKHNELRRIELSTPTKPASISAFMHFLYTGELPTEILQEHAPEMMKAGNDYEIPILRSKCEDYMVNHMNPGNTIDYLKVATQCNSSAVTKAAVKLMKTNPAGFVSGEDYQALKKDNPAALAGAFQYIILGDSSGKKKEKKPAVAKNPDLDPQIDSSLPQGRYETSFMSLGTCTCSVHPFAHSAAPGYEYRGVRFHSATPMPAAVHYIDPAFSVPE